MFLGAKQKVEMDEIMIDGKQMTVPKWKIPIILSKLKAREEMKRIEKITSYGASAPTLRWAIEQMDDSLRGDLK